VNFRPGERLDPAGHSAVIEMVMSDEDLINVPQGLLDGPQ
jgi:hypothetical protein